MITIGLAEDHAPMRNIVCTVFSKIEECQILIQAQNGFELINRIQRDHERPMLVFLDIQMPVIDGISATYFIKTHFPKIHVIALSYHTHHMVVQDIFDAGAMGYLLKENISEITIRDAIKTVMAGLPYLDNSLLLNRLITIPEKNIREYLADPEINQKEKTFLQLTATTLSNEEIAMIMNVAGDSIYNYQKSLKDKLGLHSRKDMMLYAIQHGIAKVARYKKVSALPS